jgi:Flp pilus assembly protein TadD
MTPPRRLLLIGLDGLGVDLVHPAIDAGLLPAIERLVSAGASGGLVAGVSTDPAVAWTTLATGTRPDRHRVLDGMVFDPVAGDLRPVDGWARRSHAIWNLASHADRSSVVVGWPASHPADPIRGAFVSDRFFDLSAPIGAAWPVPERSLHPAGLEAALAELRLHPDELGAAEIAPFVPRLAEVDQDRDRRLVLVMAALAETVSRHAVATHLLEQEPWSFAAIRFPMLERLAGAFLRFRAPGLEGVDERDAAIYGGVIETALRLLDNMVSVLAALAGESDLVVCSPFGVRCVPGRAMVPPPGSPRPPRLVRHEHGFVAIAGRGIAADRLVHGAAAVDLVPTMLTLMELPIGEDLPGRVLREAFVDPARVAAIPSIPSIPSWESLAGDFGRLDPQGPPVATSDAADLVRQLVDLGYLEQDPWSARFERDQRLREDHALAITHLRASEWSQAIPRLERIVAARPIDGGLIALLASCHLVQGNVARCRELADRAMLLEGSVGHARLLLATIAMTESRRDEAIEQLTQAEATGERGLAEKLAFGNLQLRRFDEAERLVAVAFAENPDSPAAFLIQAMVRLERREDQAAAEWALRATGLRYHWPEAHAVLGVALARLGHVSEAVVALERSLAQRPTVLAHRALATILEQVAWDPELVRRHRDAAEALARSMIGSTSGASR